MFKRANKVTALLVAAASVMSIVPAMASTRLGSRDGHISGGAVAFSDGKYAYSGYRTNDDETGIYYNNGSEEKEKFNPDLEDYELFNDGKASKYGTKYIYAVDNKDQYLIDLSTGKIEDDETPESKADAVKSKLKSTLKRTDRYSGTGAWDSVNLGDSLENENYDANTRILADRFGENWYKYSAKSDETGANTQIGTVDTKATFAIALPSTLPTTDYSLSTDGTVKIAPQVSMAAFRLKAIDLLAADPVFTALFDKTTLTFDGDVLIGKANTVGKLSVVNKVALDAFDAKYTVVSTLGASEAVAYKFDETVTTSQAVDAAIKAATLDVVDAAKAMVEKMSNSDVAKAAYLAELNKIEIIGKTESTKMTAEKLDAIEKLAKNATTATLDSYDEAEINNVVADGTTGDDLKGKLQLKDANAVVAKAYADGKLGSTLSVAYDHQQLIQDLINDAIANGNTTLAKISITDGTTQSTGKLGVPAYYTGYVNEDGKYIDVSYLANLNVYSTQFGKTVKVKNFGEENEDYGITVGIAQSNADNTQTGFTELAQDKDYIYAVVKVNIAERVYDKVTKKFTNQLVGDGTLQTRNFVLKISKAQGDKEHEAYLPKSVDSYFLDDSKNPIFDDGDVTDAYKVIMNYVTKNDGASRVACKDDYDVKAVNVKDGVLYATGIKHDGDVDNVKVFKISLKKDKLDLKSTTARPADKNGKDVDVFEAKLDGKSDIDIRLSDDDTNGKISDSAISYDTDGNTWVVGKGVVTKFTGIEKKEMYTCDRTFTNIDAYDEKNVIVWGDDDEVYSNVAEGTKVTAGEATAVAPQIKTGWVQGTDGTWTYNDATGTKLVSKWQNLGGVWYFLKADGIMATGWFQDGGSTWYYANGNGVMLTGWIQDGANWYYCNGSGAMLANQYVDGYWLGGSGAWVK